MLGQTSRRIGIDEGLRGQPCARFRRLDRFGMQWHIQWEPHLELKIVPARPGLPTPKGAASEVEESANTPPRPVRRDRSTRHGAGRLRHEQDIRKADPQQRSAGRRCSARPSGAWASAAWAYSGWSLAEITLGHSWDDTQGPVICSRSISVIRGQNAWN